MNLSSLVIPVLLAGVALYGMGKRVDVYGALTHGAEEGLTVLLKVLPALVGLLTAVAMFRASGALEWLTGLCAPALEFLGIPPETTPLMLVRPVSGSGALAVGSDLIATYGPDSYIGRAARKPHSTPSPCTSALPGSSAPGTRSRQPWPRT